MEDVRAVNREIGRRYDDAGYDPAAGDDLDPPYLFRRHAMDGCAPADEGAIDVLDLGCGHGRHLVRAAGFGTGRIVGVDISEASCAHARQRLGERATIVCADFLDLEPDRLGRFDLVYLIGTYYVTPPVVRAKLAQVIEGCLRPGGLAAVSYYTGAVGRAWAARVAAARERGTVDDPLIAAELLSPWLEAFETEEIAAALGLRFVDYLGCPPDDGGYVVGLFSGGDGRGGGRPTDGRAR